MVMDSCKDSNGITTKNKKVDHALKIYTKIQLMINTNKDLTKEEDVELYNGK